MKITDPGGKTWTIELETDERLLFMFVPLWSGDPQPVVTVMDAMSRVDAIS